MIFKVLLKLLAKSLSFTHACIMKNMKLLVYVKFAIDSMVKYLISDLGITNSSPYNRSHECLIPEPVLQPSLNLKSKTSNLRSDFLSQDFSSAPIVVTKCVTFTFLNVFK